MPEDSLNHQFQSDLTKRLFALPEDHKKKLPKAPNITFTKDFFIGLGSDASTGLGCTKNFSAFNPLLPLSFLVTSAHSHTPFWNNFHTKFIFPSN